MRIIWYRSSAMLDGGGWAAILSKLQEKMVLNLNSITQIVSSIYRQKKTIPIQKGNVTSKFPLYINMNSKWIMELNIKHKTLNCLE